MQTHRASKPFVLSASRKRPWGLLLVLLLHLLVLGGLFSARLTPPGATPKPRVVQLRLLPLRAEAKPSSPPLLRFSADASPPRLATSLPRPSRTPPSPSLQVTSSLPAEPLAINKGPTTTSSSPTPSSAEAPLAAASSPLNLALPTTAAPDRSPALAAVRDPRGNTQRADFGERMALALGSDPSRREEIIGPGHRRIRQGSSCYDVNDSRDSQINPFDERTRGNKLISTCKK